MKLYIIIAVITAVNAKYCKTTLDLSEGIELTSGEVELNGIQYKKEDDHLRDNTTVAESQCDCQSRPCYRKCCPRGYLYSNVKKTCEKYSPEFTLPIYNMYFKRTDKNLSMFNGLYGKLQCFNSKHLRIRVLKLNDDFNLRTDGTLLIFPKKVAEPKVKTVEEYCLDTFVTVEPDGSVKTSIDALACFDIDPKENTRTLTTVFLLISSVFILATLAVYAWLPELRNLHGLVLMAYLTSLLVAFVSLGVLQILQKLNMNDGKICEGFTVAIYYTMLSAFFWLNVLNFDIYFAISEHRGMQRSRSSMQKRFCWYAAYAYTCPLILTIILTALEYSDLPPTAFMPLIRKQGCFLRGQSKLIWLYGPMILLCTINIVLFILTAVTIRKVQNETKVLKSKDSAKHDGRNRQRFILNFKLFCVMGVLWILEVVSTFFPEAGWFWKITDAYNVLVGVFIFVIFVCKKKTLNLIKQRIMGYRGQQLNMGETFWRDNTKGNIIQRASLDTVRTYLDMKHPFQ